MDTALTSAQASLLAKIRYLCSCGIATPPWLGHLAPTPAAPFPHFWRQRQKDTAVGQSAPSNYSVRSFHTNHIANRCATQLKSRGRMPVLLPWVINWSGGHARQTAIVTPNASMENTAQASGDRLTPTVWLGPDRAAFDPMRKPDWPCRTGSVTRPNDKTEIRA